MSGFVHPDEQTALNVLLQLGMPLREARALAKKHTTPNLVVFIATAIARLAATLPEDRNPVVEIRRTLRAAAPTRTTEHPFFFPVEWPAVFVGGPGDGSKTTIGFLDQARAFSDRDGGLHRYAAEWWFPLSVGRSSGRPVRRVIQLRYAGTIKRPKWRRYSDDDAADDGDEWKHEADDGPRGTGH